MENFGLSYIFLFSILSFPWAAEQGANGATATAPNNFANHIELFVNKTTIAKKLIKVIKNWILISK